LVPVTPLKRNAAGGGAGRSGHGVMEVQTIKIQHYEPIAGPSES
jgi:hypothetical protein